MQRERILQQLERVARSPHLQGAESLCKLLRFLTAYALDHPGESVKEYEVATTLLGKDKDFDARLDPIVRVQIGRLRSKLVEYYATEGAGDDLLLELPKGSYNLVCRDRPVESSSAGAHSDSEKTVRARMKAWGWPLASVAMLLIGLGTGWWLYGLRGQPVPPRVPATLLTFWKPFLDPAKPALVVFSNAAFVGRATTGLRYFDPSRDSANQILDHYTGVGEVSAILALDRVFNALHSEMVVKRCSLLNWDETRDRSVLFVGAPSENLKLGELPWEREFAFRMIEGRGHIQNLHPQPGELERYLSSTDPQPSEDYALICRMGGPGLIRSMMVLAGLNTFGTQAAVEFVCNPQSLQKLAARTPIGANASFAALIHVQIKEGVPFESELVAVRNQL